MSRRILSMLAVASISVALAGPASAGANTVAKLMDAENRLEQPGTKVTATMRAENNKRRSEIQAAIEKLRAGQAVDPKEIDRLLDEASPWRE